MDCLREVGLLKCSLVFPFGWYFQASPGFLNCPKKALTMPTYTKLTLLPIPPWPLPAWGCSAWVQIAAVLGTWVDQEDLTLAQILHLSHFINCSCWCTHCEQEEREGEGMEHSFSTSIRQSRIEFRESLRGFEVLDIRLGGRPNGRTNSCLAELMINQCPYWTFLY